MFAGVPLAFPLDLDTGAVDEKFKRAGSTGIWKADIQCLLAAAQRTEIGRSSIQADQFQ